MLIITSPTNHNTSTNHKMFQKKTTKKVKNIFWSANRIFPWQQDGEPTENVLKGEAHSINQDQLPAYHARSGPI